jgi:hypothetical protein
MLEYLLRKSQCLCSYGVADSDQLAYFSERTDYTDE